MNKQEVKIFVGQNHAELNQDIEHYLQSRPLYVVKNIAISGITNIAISHNYMVAVVFEEITQ